MGNTFGLVILQMMMMMTEYSSLLATVCECSVQSTRKASLFFLFYILSPHNLQSMWSSVLKSSAADANTFPLKHEMSCA